MLPPDLVPQLPFRHFLYLVLMSQQPEDDVDDFDPVEVYTMEEHAILEEFSRKLGGELKANIDGESSTVTCRHRPHSRSRRYILLYELFVC